MMNETDVKNIGAVQEHVAVLRDIVQELIDLETGLPKSGATKAQMLYAIQEINKVKAIYEERTKIRQSINDEVNDASREMTESLQQMQMINKKYQKSIYPDWFLKVFGA